MKRRYWLAVLCAIFASVLIVALTSAESGDVYGLMTDTADLHDGDRIILVSDDGSYYQAMKADFSGMQVTVSDSTIIEHDGMFVLTLTETDGGWLLASNDGYLAVENGALTIVSDLADAATWSISIASDGTATVFSDGNRIVFAEQEGAYRFFCGKSGNEIAIYSISIEAERNPFGGGLWWSFANKKLTVGGSGNMPNFNTVSQQPWASVRNSIFEIEIQEGVKSIGENAFKESKSLTSVTIPDSVTNVGGYAFYECSELMTVAMGNRVTNIGSYAFSDCSGLISFTIPDSVTIIGDYAFCNCTGLQSITIPDSVTGIYSHAFYGCTDLIGIELGNNVNVIGDCTFFNTGWWNAQTDGPVYLDYILLGVKENCGQVVRIKEGTRLIATSAFYLCSTLKKVTIPDSVISIRNDAFYGCTALTQITMPCSTSIGNSAFASCGACKSVHLTAGTGTWSLQPHNTPWYYNKIALKSVIIDNGITNIGGGAFSGCTGLSEITIPDSVTFIGANAFEGCRGLTAIAIPDSVTIISPGAFLNCTGLTTISIAKSVISINNNAFYGCTALTDVWYNGTRSERNAKLYIGQSNESLVNATWHYLTEAVDGEVEWNTSDVQFKGATAYVIANGSAQTPRFTVKNKADGSVIDPAYYDYEYRENTDAGTGYVIVTFKGDYSGTCLGSFKIYLPATTETSVENIDEGILVSWAPVEGAAGYVIYRRAWSTTTGGWTAFARWNNTTETTYIDGADAAHKVFAGTRYQYGVKAYFARRTDPVTGAEIGGNVNEPSGNFNLGEVGPLKTTVRITTRVLNSVTAGTKQMTVKWTASSVFTGYEIRYATNKTFTKNVKTVKITNPKTAQKVIKSLTSGKTYYVSIRSYHELNGVTYYGGWSNIKSCKVK